MTAPLAKGWAISENPVFGTWLVRIEAGLLLTYAKVTGPGAPFWWCRREAIPTRNGRTEVLVQYLLDRHRAFWPGPVCSRAQEG